MSTQADIPSDLPDDYKAFVFQYLDAYLNSRILYALLYGMYTGILAVTLWNILLVESSALYSISLIVYLALAIRNDLGVFYIDIIAGIAKGVAPTLLIGQAAAGHTHPNDECDGSTLSSLHFQTASLEVGTTSFQESIIESAVHEIDIEAQQEWSDELVEVVERTE
ncbi:uncharacterized protein ARMOST_14788 [Armillaria ostoyae]|uniref:Uncharacterized protein n=1 Tax=Armillaria ostoyae TaxID=47428 RepID=A0A284RRS6_ARMOS|nr:uncharacterized protein ARMOST_14788 [Armillaria ostoyae]